MLDREKVVGGSGWTGRWTLNSGRWTLDAIHRTLHKILATTEEAGSYRGRSQLQRTLGLGSTMVATDRRLIVLVVSGMLVSLRVHCAGR